MTTVDERVTCQQLLSLVASAMQQVYYYDSRMYVVGTYREYSP